MRGAIVSCLLVFATTAFGQDDSPADAVSLGRAVYAQTCIACHGGDGKGAIPGVQDLTSKVGPLAKSDETLLKSIVEGYQTPSSPLAMPPKGGNPSLSESDIKAVLAYLHSEFGS